jgi:hypothetical protein
MKDQIKTAKESIQNLKKNSPEIFPEYSLLKQAERNLIVAQCALREAQSAWNKLGRYK